MIALVAVVACGDIAAPPAGHGVNVSVAPLSLPGIAYACYDMQVTNDLGEVVWSRGTPAVEGAAPSVCSNRYGNSEGGDVSYVGPCDASDNDVTDSGVALNTVTLWVDGLYDAETNLDIGRYHNPCPWPTGCSLAFECEENADVLVGFDLTIMRAANQGFFDVAVSFDDLFCSAKFDTCQDGQPMTLLFGDDEVRDWTGVIGLACSAGTDAARTTLLYGEVVVDCGAAGRFVLDPSAGPGSATATAGSATLHYAVYRGSEQLDCGTGASSCDKLYWNLAIDLADLAALNATCTLSSTATATDGGAGFTAGLPTNPGVLHPYIDVDATLTLPVPGATTGVALCHEHAPDDADSAVTTAYRGTLEGAARATAMCTQFDGTVSPTGAVSGCDFLAQHYVNTLLDVVDAGDGLLSLREAIALPNPKTVRFSVSGEIALESRLVIDAQAGLTLDALGAGITLRDHGVLLSNSQDVTIRGLAVRPGIDRHIADFVAAHGLDPVQLHFDVVVWSRTAASEATLISRADYLVEFGITRYFAFSPAWASVSQAVKDPIKDALIAYVVTVSSLDALAIVNSVRVLVDRSSFTWGSDEGLSVGGSSDEITVRHSIVAEGLEQTGHRNNVNLRTNPDTNEQYLTGHSKGSLLGGRAGGRVTFVGNVYASNMERNFRPANSDPALGAVPFAVEWVNNVVYNFHDCAANPHATIGASLALYMVNNVYVYGPATPDQRSLIEPCMVRVGSTATRIHAAGNTSKGYDPGSYPDFVSQGAWAYIRGEFGESQKLTAPYTAPAGTFPVDSLAAFEAILEAAGVPGDPVDAQIKDGVRDGTGQIISRESERP